MGDNVVPGEDARGHVFEHGFSTGFQAIVARIEHGQAFAVRGQEVVGNRVASVIAL